MLAARGRHAGHMGVVGLLVELGADLDAACGANKMTALHIAVAYRQTSIASLLVQSGASPFVETTAGLTAHDMVLREALSLELLRLIESRGLYAGWVSMRVGGYRQPWARRWVVVSQRLTPADVGNARVRVMLCCYPHWQTFSSVCRTSVCGSRLAGSELATDLILAPHVPKPKGAKCRRQGGRWVLEFRAAEDRRRDFEDFRACLHWASGLGAEESLPAPSPDSQQRPPVALQPEGRQHWASVPPSYLSEPEVSGVSLASTTSTIESQASQSDLIPARTLENTSHSGECLICLDRSVGFVFLHGDTGCAVACEVCNDKYESEMCPVCRRRITGRVKVFGL